MDILDRLVDKLIKILEFPVLFLTNLKSVTFSAAKVKGKYTKEVTE